MNKPSRRQLRQLERHVADLQRRRREAGRPLMIGFEYADGSADGLIFKTTLVGGLRLVEAVGKLKDILERAGS